MDMFGVIITEGHIITNGTTKLFPAVSIADQRAAYYDYEQDRIDGTEFWRRIGSPHGAAESDAMLFSGFELDPAFGTLADAVAGSMKIAVLSNMPKDWKNHVLSFGIGPQLHSFFTSGEEGAWKPNNDFFLMACSKLGVEPGDCIFVDDQRRNVEAAHLLGMEGVWVQREGQSNFPSDFQPRYTVAELGELAELIQS